MLRILGSKRVRCVPRGTRAPHFRVKTRTVRTAGYSCSAFWGQNAYGAYRRDTRGRFCPRRRVGERRSSVRGTGGVAVERRVAVRGTGGAEGKNIPSHFPARNILFLTRVRYGEDSPRAAGGARIRKARRVSAGASVRGGRCQWGLGSSGMARIRQGLRLLPGA